MFNFYSVFILFTNQPAINPHITPTLDPASYITHRNPWQCGDAIKNGDASTPKTLNGVQNFTYKCVAM